MGKPSVFLSAGDPSGDNAASRLVAALKTGAPDLEVFGLGGDHLKAAGQEQFVDGSQLAVLGFWEVARRYFFFRSLMHRCVAEIARRRPSCVVLVDYPGFNLRLARRIRHLGIPILYYIAPQVWAWGRGRVSELRELVDRLLVILPFEERFFKRHAIEATFVGHYLVEDIPDRFIASLVPENGHLALLPGSRAQEIQHMLRPMAGAAARFCRAHRTKAVVAGLTGRFPYEKVLRDFMDDDIAIVYDKPREVIHGASIVLTASGTATLETGIIGRPMVVLYRTGFLSYQIARRLVTLDRIALVNLVADEIIAPELIQRDASPDRLFHALDELRGDRERLEKIYDRLTRIPERLGGVGASQRAAEIVGQYI
jgi:lipid-A-disaccharide synthase